MEFFEVVSFKNIGVLVALYGLFLRVRSDLRICEIIRVKELHVAMHKLEPVPTPVVAPKPAPPVPVQPELTQPKPEAAPGLGAV